MTEGTKACPFCAETIQAAAIVCRYCGRELNTEAKADDAKLIDQEIAAYTHQGWQVLNRTDTAIQFRKPRRWSTDLLGLFVLLPVLVGCFWYWAFGIALIGLVVVLVDYLSKKDELAYVTIDQIRAAIEKQRQEASANVARILPFDRGWVCSSCNGAVREDAKTCKHCKKPLYMPALYIAEPPRQ